MTLQFPIFPRDYFQPSPAKQFLSLKNSPGILNPAYIDQIFQELKPIKPDNLMGEWDGYILSTGHPFESELEELNWFGNTFDSKDDVAPLMVAKHGDRVRFEDWGGASLCEMKYQGIVSAALIYDERPTMVYYRAVRSNMVAGIMESKRFGQAGKVYFYLTK
ncbi:uncharacterized protein N7503_005284 [Penicillium pulvis]|uniref:uncharacterized protein n=1 Tax=Penicillium pulvis TaxID=1562058 RepID=UPI00254814DF|nr:uncharacterized protein N7503_005284 [Penicillium pulvis]KAJ5802834.1 hypothetical protein N7503_005284 [Penicillium pulvis]